MSNTDRTRRKVTRRSTVDEDAKNPSTSRRRTQAERSETTRKLVLDATIRILVRKGAAGLRIGEVVKEAGVDPCGIRLRQRTIGRNVPAAGQACATRRQY